MCVCLFVFPLDLLLNRDAPFTLTIVNTLSSSPIEFLVTAITWKGYFLEAHTYLTF